MANFLKKKNEAYSTLAISLDSVNTSVQVVDASKFPSSVPFLITVWNKSQYPNPADDPTTEIMKVTSVNGNTFTVLRGQESMGSYAHSSGNYVINPITAGTFEEIEYQVNVALDAIDSLSSGTASASNLGTGVGVYAKQEGVDLQFKSLKAGTNVTISSDANEITINSTDVGTTYTGGNGIDISVADVISVKDIDFSNNGVTKINFDTTITPTLAEGEASWSTVNKCLNIGMPNGSVLQVGKEEYVDFQNDTGSTITEGTPLMFGSAIGNSGKIRAVRAIANGTIPHEYFIGVATNNVANGDTGLSTMFGDVNAWNTTGSQYGESWANAQVLYVSATNAGYLTKTQPPAPNNVIQVGFVINAHATNGTFKLMPTSSCKFTELSDVNGMALTTSGQIPIWNQSSGYFDFTDNINNYATTVVASGKQSFHGVVARSTVAGLNCLPSHLTTTTFTLGATANPIQYYYNGTLVTVSSNKTCTLNDGAGLYFIYFTNTTGDIYATKTFTFPTLGFDILLATVYWNGLDYGLVGDERHSYDRDREWHRWAHKYVGARYGSGFDFVPTGAGATATFTMSGGVHVDEDIEFGAVASSSYPTPHALRTWYQAGATSYAFDNTTSTIPYRAGLGSRPMYVNSADYSLVTMASAVNRYINYFIYSTQDLHTPIYCFTETVSAAVASANGYSSLANARAVPFPNLSGMRISGELKPLYRLVVRADGQVQAITPADDYRTVSSLPMSAGTTSTTASSVSVIPNGGIVSTTVQTALEELDSEIQAIPSGIFKTPYNATATAEQTQFTLASNIIFPIVFVNGLFKTSGAGKDYTFATNVVTFTYGLDAGDEVSIIYI